MSKLMKAPTSRGAPQDRAQALLQRLDERSGSAG
jgi:hypothetical protein